MFERILVAIDQSAVREAVIAAAGALTGLVGGTVAIVVLFGALLAQPAFGLWVSPVPPVGVSAGSMAGSLVQAAMLLAIATTLRGAGPGPDRGAPNAVRINPGGGSPGHGVPAGPRGQGGRGPVTGRAVGEETLADARPSGRERAGRPSWMC